MVAPSGELETARVTSSRGLEQGAHAEDAAQQDNRRGCADHQLLALRRRPGLTLRLQELLDARIQLARRLFRPGLQLGIGLMLHCEAGGAIAHGFQLRRIGGRGRRLAHQIELRQHPIVQFAHLGRHRLAQPLEARLFRIRQAGRDRFRPTLPRASPAFAQLLGLAQALVDDLFLLPLPDGSLQTFRQGELRIERRDLAGQGFGRAPIRLHRRLSIFGQAGEHELAGGRIALLRAGRLR